MERMSGTKKTDKVRVTLDLSPQFNERLESLEALVDASSKAELIRQALQLYEYVVKRTLEGCTFRAIARNGHEENLVVLVGMSPAPALDENEALAAR